MNEKKQMDAILIHGMGRTPLAMSILAARLGRYGIQPHLFGYSVTFERRNACFRRLEYFITKRVNTNEFIMIGHSLGAVLIRAIMPRLIHKPAACFLLASPTRVCKAARNFGHHPLARLLGGEIGQLLADQQFMESLPPMGVPAKIYAGTGGPRGHHSPFGEEPNDGVLTINETLLPGVPVQTFPVLHTFIMNSNVVTHDIVRIATSHASPSENDAG